MNDRKDLVARFEAARKRQAELDELARPLVEARARRLRILHDIVADRFDGADVEFERHYSSAPDEISSYAVFHRKKSVRASVKEFVKGSIPKLGLKIEYWCSSDVIDIGLRYEQSTALEKLAMLELID